MKSRVKIAFALLIAVGLAVPVVWLSRRPIQFVPVEHPPESSAEQSAALQIKNARAAVEKAIGNPGAAWLDLGKIYLAHNFFPAAAGCFTNAERGLRGSFDARYGIASALFEQGAIPVAESAAQQALAILPKSRTNAAAMRKGAILFLADCAERQNRPDEARKLYEESLADAPNELYSLLKLGQMDAARGNYTNAAARLEMALGRDPGNREIRQQLSATLRRLGQETKAAELVQGLSATDTPKPTHRPDPWRDEVTILNRSSAMLNTVAVELLRAGRFARAAQFLAEAWSSNPTNTIVAANYAVSLLALDDVSTAKQVLEKAILIDPNREDLQQHLAKVRARAGATNEAMLIALDWIRRSPKDAAPLRLAGELCALNGDYARAEDYYRQAVALSPSDVASQIGAGVWIAAQGKTRAARDYFEASLNALGDRSELRHNLVRLRIASQDTSLRDPASDLTQAQSLVDSHPTAPRLETFALAKAENGAWDEAERIMRRVIDATGDDGAAFLRRRQQRVLESILAKRAFTEPWPFADVP